MKYFLFTSIVIALIVGNYQHPKANPTQTTTYKTNTPKPTKRQLYDSCKGIMLSAKAPFYIIDNQNVEGVSIDPFSKKMTAFTCSCNHSDKTATFTEIPITPESSITEIDSEGNERVIVIK